MEKKITIESIEDADGCETVDFTTIGFSPFEIIGILTFYRDKIEVDMMHDNKNEKLTKITKPE